jgi:hypothetical protein
MRISAIGFLAFAACLGIAGGSALAAPPASKIVTATHARVNAEGTKAPKAKVHHIAGEVVSVSDTDLVISHKRGKAMEHITFHLTAETKKEGEVAEGKQVMVYYTVEKAEKTATRIREITPKGKPKK